MARLVARWTWGGLVLTLSGSLAGLAVVGPVPPEPPGGDGEVRARARPAVAAPVPPGAPSAAPTPAPLVQRGTGALLDAPGTGARRGRGPLQRYTVQVEGGVGVDPAGFAREVESVLGDPRSWGAGGRASFQRVTAGPVTFRVVLASPDTTDRLCAPLDTGGSFSCGNGSRAVLNLRRWQRGAPAYTGDLAGYRRYLVNHEVGHTLGHGHARCPSSGALAPVMVQQTKGVGSCRKNPWPYP